jgi:hypothetical protein
VPSHPRNSDAQLDIPSILRRNQIPPKVIAAGNYQDGERMKLKKLEGLLAEGNWSESKDGGKDKGNAPRKKRRGTKKSEEESRGGTRKSGSPACIKDNLFGTGHPHDDENTKRQGRR